MQSNETYEQIAVIDYCDFRKIPVVHVPNEGKRSAKTGKMLKKLGLRPGFPDLFIPVAKRDCHGLMIEMKYGKNKPTEKQMEWLDLLNANGYKAVICYGFDEAKETLDWYMGV